MKCLWGSLGIKDGISKAFGVKFRDIAIETLDGCSDDSSRVTIVMRLLILVNRCSK